MNENLATDLSVTTQQVTSMTPDALMDTIGDFVGTFVTSSLVTYLLIAIGLFLMNKKWKENDAWIAFIPIVQLWSYFQASHKPFLEYFVYPFIAVIIGSALSILTFGLTGIVAFIYAFVMYIKLLHAISLRAGRGTWTTVGFFFIPFIMFPYVGFTMKEKE